jgi:ADP-ribose pyrophosphatase YjhB (NUDIX family)
MNWLTAAQRLLALAQTGLAYQQNEFDRERYAEIQTIALDLIKNLSSEPPPTPLSNLFIQPVDYPTPKVDIRAVVFENDKILLVKEKSDGLWALPGGWADVGYSPREVAEKEVWEEAGRVVKAMRLLAVVDKKCHPHPPQSWYVYKIFILCESQNETLGTGTETDDVAFFGKDELPPLSLHRNTKEQIEMMFSIESQSAVPVYFD